MPPSKPLRILLLCDRLPDGPVDGLLLRVHHLLAALSGRHRVDLVCWREPGQTLPSDRPRFARTWLLDRPLKTRPGAWWRPLMDWNPDHIYPRSEPLARLLNHDLNPADYDVIWDAGAVLFTHLPPRWHRVPLVADLVDDLVLTHRRERQQSTTLLARLRLWKYGVVFGRFERQTLRRAHTCVVVTQQDADSFRAVSPGVPVSVVPNGVDTRYFAPAAQASAADRIAFEGNLGFGPNATAAAHLAQQIMPRIWAVRPSTQLVLVGRNPTPALLALAGPNVVLTGEVSDIRPHLLGAKVFVCPLHTGAGIKNKVLQAWALAMPVVTTSIGAQGLDASDGLDLLVRDGDADMADAVIGLLGDDGWRQRLADAGRQAAVVRFSWSEMALRFEAVLQRAAHSVAAVH